MKSTNLPWNALVGGPNSGKTTTVNYLAERGYLTVHEPARELLQRPEVDAEALSADQLRMQWAIGMYAVYLHGATHHRDIEKLGHDVMRITDGTPLDAMTHLRVRGVEPDPKIEYFCRFFQYHRAFLLEPTPWEPDSMRPPKEIALAVYEAAGDVYREYGHEVITIPLMPVEERASMIMDELA